MMTPNQQKAGMRFQKKIGRMLKKNFKGLREEVELWNMRRCDFWIPLEKILIECKSRLYEGTAKQILDYERLLGQAQKKIVIIGNWGIGLEEFKKEAQALEKDVQELYEEKLTEEITRELSFDKIYIWNVPIIEKKKKRRR